MNHCITRPWVWAGCQVSLWVYVLWLQVCYPSGCGHVVGSHLGPMCWHILGLVSILALDVSMLSGKNLDPCILGVQSANLGMSIIEAVVTIQVSSGQCFGYSLHSISSFACPQH